MSLEEAINNPIKLELQQEEPMLIGIIRSGIETTATPTPLVAAQPALVPDLGDQGTDARSDSPDSSWANKVHFVTLGFVLNCSLLKIPSTDECFV